MTTENQNESSLFTIDQAALCLGITVDLIVAAIGAGELSKPPENFNYLEDELLISKDELLTWFNIHLIKIFSEIYEKLEKIYKSKIYEKDNILKVLDGLDGYYHFPIVKCNENTTLFRSRAIKILDNKNFRPPNSDQASKGRCNFQREPKIYTCLTPNTTIFESKNNLFEGCEMTIFKLKTKKVIHVPCIAFKDNLTNINNFSEKIIDLHKKLTMLLSEFFIYEELNIYDLTSSVCEYLMYGSKKHKELRINHPESSYLPKEGLFYPSVAAKHESKNLVIDLNFNKNLEYCDAQLIKIDKILFRNINNNIKLNNENYNGTNIKFDLIFKINIIASTKIKNINLDENVNWEKLDRPLNMTIYPNDCHIDLNGNFSENEIKIMQFWKEDESWFKFNLPCVT